MDKGMEYLRFGTMGVIGVLGMIFFRGTYIFNIAALIFFVSVLIFVIVALVPSKPLHRHLVRRRV